MTCIAHGGGVVIMVGQNGLILRSNNHGETWETTSLRPDLQIYSVTYGTNRFTAAARDAEGGLILTSKDGREWSETNAPDGFEPEYTDHDFIRLYHHNGRYALAWMDTLFLSEDGESWTPIQFDGISFIEGVALSDDHIVVAGVYKVVSSSDGSLWDDITPEAIIPGSLMSIPFLDLLYSGESWMLLGLGGHYFISSDLQHWEQKAFPEEAEIERIYYINSTYYGADTGLVLESHDGIHWQSIYDRETYYYVTRMIHDGIRYYAIQARRLLFAKSDSLSVMTFPRQSASTDPRSPREMEYSSQVVKMDPWSGFLLTKDQLGIIRLPYPTAPTPFTSQTAGF